MDAWSAVRVPTAERGPPIEGTCPQSYPWRYITRTRGTPIHSTPDVVNLPMQPGSDHLVCGVAQGIRDAYRRVRTRQLDTVRQGARRASHVSQPSRRVSCRACRCWCRLGDPV